MTEEHSNENQIKTTSNKWLKIVLIAVFSLAVILTAALTFTVVKNLVKTWEITSLPGLPVLSNEVTSTPNEEGIIVDQNTPMQVSTGPTAPEWDGAQRVTLLMMGLDYRDWASGEGPPRRLRGRRMHPA